MKQDELEPLEVGYQDEKVIFYLRMISVAEEDAINTRLRDVADSGSESKKYDIYWQALSASSVKMPEVVKGESREEVSFSDYFSEQTPRKERLIRQAYITFINRLYPEALFLPSSPQ